MIKLYKINTGSCGGCDVEIAITIAMDPELTWVDSPYEADALLLTGPVTVGCRVAVLNLLREISTLPVVAIGRCSIDGHPFGKGGVRELKNLAVRLQLDGCPPASEAIAAAVREALGQGTQGVSDQE